MNMTKILSLTDELKFLEGCEVILQVPQKISKL